MSLPPQLHLDKDKYLQEVFEHLCNLRLRKPYGVVNEVRELLDYLEIDYEATSAMGKSEFRDQYPILTAQCSSDAFVIRTFPKKESNIMLVGKGVTYDSGGYNIKDDTMKDMYFDKIGAILALIVSIKMEIPATIAFLDNMLNPNFLPGDIITSRKGKRILIENTDAEGRLLLADLLESIPDETRVLTLATLTGAACQFMGDRIGALVHTTSGALRGELASTFKEKEQECFPAPIHSKYDTAVLAKTKFADISNCPDDKEAGSQHAYSFLKHFHPENKLVHADIAPMMQDENGDALGWGIRDIQHLTLLVDRNIIV